MGDDDQTPPRRHAQPPPRQDDEETLVECPRCSECVCCRGVGAVSPAVALMWSTLAPKGVR